jgi:hypothetical protein
MFKLYKSVLLLSLLTFLTQGLTAQKYCLKFNLSKSTTTTADFTVLLAATGSTFNLGASNLQFKYNSKALSNPTIISNTLTTTGTFNAITLTQPQPTSLDNATDGLVSLNFDFTGATGTGLPVGLVGAEIAVVRFQIVDAALTPNFRAYENGTAGTVVFNDNATTPALLAANGTCDPYNARIPIITAKVSNTPTGALITKFDRQKVTLDWTTTFEKPSTYFVVERSINGQPFKPVGNFLFATYTYIDVNPLKGFNKYRIRQVGVDGAESLSNVVDIELEKEAEISVYPAVVTELNGFLTLDVPRPTALDRLEYHIFNFYGRELLRGKTAERLDINVFQLPVGSYILKVGDDNKMFIRQ